MVDISELTGKISALKVFKDQINTAIRDEQEAQRMYDKMAAQADKAGARTYSSMLIQTYRYQILWVYIPYYF